MKILTDDVEVVIGVDPHKFTHTAAFISSGTGKHHRTQTVSADPAGFADLYKSAAGLAESRCWVVEGCGSWGRGLTTWLRDRNEQVAEIDVPRRPLRRNGLKTDELDALRVAREALGRDDLAVPRAAGDRDTLAVLLGARRSAIQGATNTERQLTGIAVTCPEVLAAKLRGKNTAQVAATCRRWRPACTPSATGIAETMQTLARRSQQLRIEANDHQHKIEQIVTRLRPDLLEIIGVGPVVAATMLVAWSHPGRIRNERAFAMLAGVAPIPASSGLTDRHRLNRRGDRQLNRALHIIALQRQRHDPTTKAYFERRRAEGKTDREIRRCLKRYIARDLYRILESQP